MRKHPISFLFAWAFAAYLGYGQTDLPQSKPLDIQAANKLDPKGSTNQGTSLNIPSVLDRPPEIDFDPNKRNPVKMLPDRNLVQAGTGLKIDPRVRRTEKQGGANQRFGNQYLGDLKSNGKFIGIVCRDHEYVDGDRVRISVNGKVVDPNVLLTSGFKGINVDLVKGFNRLDFEALNEGSSPPNTAQVDVYDDMGKLVFSNRWLLSEGSKATLIVTKE